MHTSLQGQTVRLSRVVSIVANRRTLPIQYVLSIKI
jgi:hypothetical protein